MRRVVPLCTLVAALACGPGAAAADDMGGWCAQAKKAPSLVTCSDAELRQQAQAAIGDPRPSLSGDDLEKYFRDLSTASLPAPARSWR